MKPKEYGPEPNGSYYTRSDFRAVRKEMLKYNKQVVGVTHDVRAVFEDEFARYVGAEFAIGVSSAQAGIETVLRCLSPTCHDEIVSNAINFHGTHQAIVSSGAKLVLCESSKNALNMDVDDLQQRITQNTVAILMTDMNGIPNDYDRIEQIICHANAKYGRNIRLIVDAARSCGAVYKGKKVGSFGWCTIFSFQSKKALCTLGEGGMVTTSSEDLKEMIECYSRFGKSKYLGSNHKLSTVQSAVGVTQLKKLDSRNRRRRKLALWRNELLEKRIAGITIPREPARCFCTYTYYSLVLPSIWTSAMRDSLILALGRSCGVRCCVANDVTFITNPILKDYIDVDACPASLEIGKRVISLPIHSSYSSSDNRYICKSFLEQYEAILSIEQKRRGV